MRWPATTLLILALQLLLAAALVPLFAWCARRRRSRAMWMRARRALMRVAPYAAAAAVALWFLAGTLEPQWPHALAGVPSTAGCYLLLYAGSLERAGRLRGARRQARLGGFLIVLGMFVFTSVTFSSLLFRRAYHRAMLHDSSDAALLLVLGVVLLGTSAFIGLLGGLSGKPRPSAGFATLFHVAALTSTLAANALAR